MAATTPSASVAYRSPIWPLFIAPLVAGIYYLAVKGAFAQSIIPVLGRTDFFDLTVPRWGSHWVYRAAAEVIAAGFGTFMAAGLAHGRERAAAILGGCAISLGFISKLAFVFLDWKYLDSEELSAPEPWYQYGIDVAMIFASPFIGAYVSEAAEDMHREAPNGFGGINRLHFLWLWFAAFWYALGLITPMARFYIAGQDEGVVVLFLVVLINALPAAVVAVPGFYGLALLAGHHGGSMHPAGRNMVGMLVLVFGLVVGMVVQNVWYWGFRKLYEAMFG
jgi:hypothetical protein